MKIESELNEFLQAVDGIYGLYLDTTTGFFKWHWALLDIQEDASTYTGKSLKELDEDYFEYVDGNKGKDDENLSHKCRFKELKERIVTGGGNHKLMANLCLILINEYWNNYRDELKKRTGKTVDSDLMGDIRYLRNSILKHKSFGNHEMKKCKVIKWLKEGDSIRIDENQMKEIVRMIKKEITNINKKYFT